MTKWVILFLLTLVAIGGALALVLLPAKTPATPLPPAEEQASSTPAANASVTTKGNADIIRLTSPKPNEKISSPLIVEGEARGTWYFEASFPVVLTDWDGKIIAEGIAQAQGDWMTESYVPFKATLTFVAPTSSPSVPDTGSLILQKDNPSGLPEHDDALEITVRF